MTSAMVAPMPPMLSLDKGVQLSSFQKGSCEDPLQEFMQVAESFRAVVTRVEMHFMTEKHRMVCERAILDAERESLAEAQCRADRSLRAVEEATAIVTAAHARTLTLDRVHGTKSLPPSVIQSTEDSSSIARVSNVALATGQHDVCDTVDTATSRACADASKDKVPCEKTDEASPVDNVGAISFGGGDRHGCDKTDEASPADNVGAISVGGGDRHGESDIDGSCAASAAASTDVAAAGTVSIAPTPAIQRSIVSSALVGALPPKPGRPPPAASPPATPSEDSDRPPAMRFKEPPTQKRKPTSTVSTTEGKGSPSVKAPPVTSQHLPSVQADDEEVDGTGAAERWISQKLVEWPEPPPARVLDDELPLPPPEDSIPRKAMPVSGRVKAAAPPRGTVATTLAVAAAAAAAAPPPPPPPSTQEAQPPTPKSRYKAPPREFAKACIAKCVGSVSSNGAIDDESSSSLRGNSGSESGQQRLRQHEGTVAPATKARMKMPPSREKIVPKA
eukprot:TRINITY_DN34116_c0_g1_i1.p1 TRINITY_DN34116_c0_g1~~TRINITY_DN34116_c0_g1_i1.p1  ORF type:complete len:504 (-),score=102.86 TRINITY_DN34116_c0_g1_i1:211-1722(-)